MNIYINRNIYIYTKINTYIHTYILYIYIWYPPETYLFYIFITWLGQKGVTLYTRTIQNAFSAKSKI